MKASVTAVVFDLDSTLRNSAHRHHLSPVQNPDSDWDKFSAAGLHDTPMNGPVMAMRLHWAEHQIHICSGSNESARSETEQWLAEHAPWYDFLALRPEGDHTENGQRKVAYIRSLEAQGTTVLLMYEDWGVSSRLIEQVTNVPVVTVNPLYPCAQCGWDQMSSPRVDNQTEAPLLQGTVLPPQSAITGRVHHVPGKEGWHSVDQCSPGYCGGPPPAV